MGELQSPAYLLSDADGLGFPVTRVVTRRLAFSYQYSESHIKIKHAIPGRVELLLAVFAQELFYLAAAVGEKMGEPGVAVGAGACVEPVG